MVCIAGAQPCNHHHRLVFQMCYERSYDADNPVRDQEVVSNALKSQRIKHVSGENRLNKNQQKQH